MRKVLTLILLTTCLTSYGQVVDSLKDKGIKINYNEPYNEPFTLSGLSGPLFMLSLNNQVIEVKQGEIFSDSSRIDPNWIKSVQVYKGKDAVEKYGLRAQHGAVLIDLRSESAYKLPIELKKKFTANKN